MENLSPVEKNKKGKVIHSGKRQCIINVYKRVLADNPDMLKDCAVEKVSNLIGISKRSVYSIVSLYKTNHILGLSSPKNKKNKPNILEKLDDFTKCAIRRKVHEFFFRNEQPTLNKVLQKVNEDLDLPNFKRTTFFRLLKLLKFKYRKSGRNMFVCDRDDIILWRRKYLRQIKKFREEGRKIYYQDETWVNEGHVKKYVWHDDTVKSNRDAILNGLSTGLKTPSGKGQRLIISHMGNEDGFKQDALLLFHSKSSGDYHKEMNGDTFKEYFKKILQTVENNSVIVLDNAPYHSVKCEKLPNSNWNKENICQWLQNKGITADTSMLKKELLEIAKLEKPKYDKYEIDELAAKNNKTVLRLPPYHCELNPIELVWAQVKGYVAARNVTYKIDEVRHLFVDGLGEVTSEKWKKCVEHVKKEEEKLWKLDNLIEDIEESTPFVINVGSESSEEDSDLAQELD